MTAAPLAARWRDLLAALARGKAGPGGQALADVLGGLYALRPPVPPQVVVVVDEISALAEEACGPLGAELARRLEKGRSAGVALVLVGSRPTATWITLAAPRAHGPFPCPCARPGNQTPRKGDL